MDYFLNLTRIVMGDKSTSIKSILFLDYYFLILHRLQFNGLIKIILFD